MVRCSYIFSARESNWGVLITLRDNHGVTGFCDTAAFVTKTGSQIKMHQESQVVKAWSDLQHTVGPQQPWIIALPGSSTLF